MEAKQQQQDTSGATITGLVKWYDSVKGYGFIVPDDGGSDVMVHASCVRAFGRVNLPEGARVKVVAGMGARGMHAQEIIELDEPEIPAREEEPTRPTEYLGPEAVNGPLEAARVKWFDKQKGFGFVNIFGNAEDIFVHMETVRRCGFQDLASGEGMAVRTFRGPRGLMVSELRLWEAGVLAAERTS